MITILLLDCEICNKMHLSLLVLKSWNQLSFSIGGALQIVILIRMIIRDLLQLALQVLYSHNLLMTEATVMLSRGRGDSSGVAVHLLWESGVS